MECHEIQFLKTFIFSISTFFSLTATGSLAGSVSMHYLASLLTVF